ncbi:hypothetical protein [Nostoc sp. 2RC]|nr:hypothetical protein [Nostoc sp. 2RC]
MSQRFLCDRNFWALGKGHWALGMRHGVWGDEEDEGDGLRGRRE